MITPTTELAFILEDQALSDTKQKNAENSRKHRHTQGRQPLTNLNASSVSSSPSTRKAREIAATSLKRELAEALQPLQGIKPLQTQADASCGQHRKCDLLVGSGGFNLVPDTQPNKCGGVHFVRDVQENVPSICRSNGGSARGKRHRRRTLSFTTAGSHLCVQEDAIRRSSAPEHGTTRPCSSPDDVREDGAGILGVASMSNREFLNLQGQCYPSKGAERRCSLQFSLFSPTSNNDEDHRVENLMAPAMTATRAKSVTSIEHPNEPHEEARRRCHSICGDTLVHVLKESTSPHAPASKRCRHARDQSRSCVSSDDSTAVAFYTGDFGGSATSGVSEHTAPLSSVTKTFGSPELMENAPVAYRPQHQILAAPTIDKHNGASAAGPNARNVMLLSPGPSVRGDCQQRCVLPTTDTLHRFSPLIRLVTPETVHRLLNHEFDDRVSEYIIVDCRFPFEYEGGHIESAVNHWNVELAINAFFAHPVVTAGNGGRTVVLFHCEFSSHRAPTMLCNLRRMDAHITTGVDGLLFPEFYLIEGGYSVFFEKYPQHCTPQSYTKMKDKRYAKDNTQFETRMRCSWEKASRCSNYDGNEFIARMKDLVSEHGVSDGAARAREEALALRAQSMSSPTSCTRSVAESPSTPRTLTLL
eukprot:m.1205678 g.1205678  ORF g.1205678 m.1205678 type:complete len:644 (-) comp24583_c0_seq5:2639-4570(-)